LSCSIQVAAVELVLKLKMSFESPPRGTYLRAQNELNELFLVYPVYFVDD
jgi:hypothetical protein